MLVPPHRVSGPVHRRVPLGQPAVVLVVPPADHTRHRNAHRSTRLDHRAVTAIQPLVGQRQLAQRVVHVRVHAGVVQHHVRLDLFDQRAQAAEGQTPARRGRMRFALALDVLAIEQRGEVRLVAVALGQREVEVARRLASREVLAAVHGKRKDIRRVGERDRGAVAVVHIQVDDEHVPGEALAAEEGGGHGEVVEDAKARAEAGMGVVRAAGEVAREAVLEGEPCGEDRPAHGGFRAVDQPLGPGQADAPHRVSRQLPGRECRYIVRVVDQRQHVVAGPLGGVERTGLRHARFHQHVSQQVELRHGKAMPLRQRRDVPIAMDQRKRRQT